MSASTADAPREVRGAFIGALSPRRVDQALEGLRFQQGSFFTR